MSQAPVNRATKWFYRGVWGVLTGLFKVPEHPPTLPSFSGEEVKSFKPSPRFLSYLKLQFWLGLVFVIVLSLIGAGVGAVAEPFVGGLIFVAELFIFGAITALGYLTIHLRYDTTWYVMTDRSLRIRRGIWLIRETTLTFENVQNVNVRQGPLQRFFGIANVLVETAGGGGGQTQAGAHGQNMIEHRGLIEGVADAEKIRDSLLVRLRRSRSAGLGDEGGADEEHLELSAHSSLSSSAIWTPEHISLLREIRDAAKTLNP